MEKAYDLKALGQKLMAKGLPIAEGALEASALQCWEAVKEWTLESAVMSENKFDDAIAPMAIGAMDPVVQSEIAKVDIDGDGK